MKSKAAYILVISLILIIGHLTSAIAVTDAELEALEKQIEQLEVEEKQKADAEAKRKAELEKQQLDEAKQVAEEKRKAQAQRQKEEQRILAEQKRIEKEKRKAAEARLAELERQRQEEDAKKRAEKEKKEKSNLLLSKEKDLALIKEGATVSISTGEDPSSSNEAAIDGKTNDYGMQHGWAASSWKLPGSYIFVTLGEVSFINKIRFLLWDKDNRYYQYRIEVSRDEQQWEVISDKNYGEWRSWQELIIEPKEIKYIKIIGLYNSATFLFVENPWFHVVEIEAFGMPLSEMK